MPHRNDKPLVSIILFSYNQENFITEAVESLLNQTYSPLEIILSDDCSKDDTFNRMKRLAKAYKGPHKVRLNHNKKNLGVIAHMNKALNLTKGELIFAAAGDDISLPERCEKVVSYWLANKKKANLIATDAFDMSFDGKILGVKKTDDLENWHNIDDWFIRSPYFFGSSHSWSRDLITRFGALNPNVKQEDQIMVFRAILTGCAANISEPLVKHRRGGVSQKENHAIDVYKKRRELISGNLNSLEFIKQCMKDAKTLGQEKVAEAGFKDKIKFEQMVSGLFQSNSTLKALRIAFSTKEVSIFKKIRFLTYAAFPYLIAPFFLIKKKFMAIIK